MCICLVLRVCLLVPLGLAHAKRGTINRDSDSKFQMLIAGGLMPEYGGYARNLVSIRTLNFIEYHGDNHFCTGVILSSRTILTAAHCVTDRHKSVMNARSLLVVFASLRRLGAYTRDETGRVDRIVVHPKYRRYVNYDVAVLRLRARIPGNLREVKPIMQRKRNNITVGLRCLTMGWGQVYPHGPYSDAMMFLEVIIRESDFCKNMLHFVSEANICGETKAEGQVCPGDLGGPLMCKDALAGIIGGSQSCEGIQSIKFANYAYVENWVLSTVHLMSSTDRIWVSPFFCTLYFLTLVQHFFSL